MKRNLIFALLFLFLILNGKNYSQQEQKIFVASWNLENFFDTNDDAGKRDEEFTPNGKKEWTEERLKTKYENLGKVINSMNDGKGPDILGVEEVEHAYLLENLVRGQISGRNYRIAYAETPDNRGIDNGLIYDADLFKLKSIKPYEVFLDSGWPTRFVLGVTLEFNGIDLHVFVNHWPSRSGGQEKSEPNRMKAATTLSYACSEIISNEEHPYIIMVGDFNDEPDNKSIKNVLGAFEYTCMGMPAGFHEFYNLSSKIHQEGLGTYLYRGDWNMLDQMIVSEQLLRDDSSLKYDDCSFEIIKPEFMVTKEGKYKGAAIPTFGGRTYLGGYSDHFPIGAYFIFQADEK